MDTLNLANVRQSFGNSVYNWKIQEVAAERIDGRVSLVKKVNVLLVSLVLLSLALQVFPSTMISDIHKGWLDIGGTILSVFEISFLIFLLSYGFEEKFNQHKKVALSFRSIRDRYINLITDIMNEQAEGEATIVRRDALLSEFQAICNLAPQTTRKNYKVTQSRLKPHMKQGSIKQMATWIRALFQDTEIRNEDFTLSDEEIDLFLPKNLRLK